MTPLRKHDSAKRCPESLLLNVFSVSLCLCG